MRGAEGGGGGQDFVRNTEQRANRAGRAGVERAAAPSQQQRQPGGRRLVNTCKAHRRAKDAAVDALQLRPQPPLELRRVRRRARRGRGGRGGRLCGVWVWGWDEELGILAAASRSSSTQQAAARAARLRAPPRKAKPLPPSLILLRSPASCCSALLASSAASPLFHVYWCCSVPNARCCCCGARAAAAFLRANCDL